MKLFFVSLIATLLTTATFAEAGDPPATDQTTHSFLQYVHRTQPLSPQRRQAVIDRVYHAAFKRYGNIVAPQPNTFVESCVHERATKPNQASVSWRIQHRGTTGHVAIVLHRNVSPDQPPVRQIHIVSNKRRPDQLHIKYVIPESPGSTKERSWLASMTTADRERELDLTEQVPGVISPTMNRLSIEAFSMSLGPNENWKMPALDEPEITALQKLIDESADPLTTGYGPLDHVLHLAGVL